MKRPPASSHVRSEPDVEPLVRERVLVQDGHLWPAASAAVATDEPTRPAPTIEDEHRRERYPAAPSDSDAPARRAALVGPAAAPEPRPVAARAPASVAGRRRGEDHPARRLVDDVLRDVPHEVVAAGRRGRPAARPPRIRDGSSAASTIASHAAPLGLLDDRLRRRGGRAPSPSRPRRPRTPPPPPWRARSAARARLSCASGSARVDRQRHRHLEDPQRLDRRALPSQASSVLLGGQAPGGLDDVVVERRAEDRHEDRAVLGLGALARAAPPRAR